MQYKINHLGRLGPLDMEHKKRANIKRSKLEKNKEEERRPQELKEEDIARSENETTKNVLAVRPLQLLIKLRHSCV
jgi:non-structural maintenance of chromosomes element 4